MMIALVLFALLLQDDLARLVDRLGADAVEERDAAFKQIKERGAAALPALKAGLDHPDAEVAGRIRLLVRTIEIQASLTPRFQKAFPGAEDRLAGPDPRVWTKHFLEASAAPGEKRLHPELEAADLEALAAPAFQAAKGDEIRSIAKACGSLRIKSAVPALLDFLRKTRGGSFAVSQALGEIGDPAAIPVLLDFPSLRDGDQLGSTAPDLARFGAAAWPEYERRILDWKKTLHGPGRGGLALSLMLLEDHGSEKVDPARLALLEDVMSRKSGFETDQTYADVSALRILLRVLAPKHPTLVVDTLWSLADQPMNFRLSFASCSELPTEILRPMIETLWERAQKTPGLAEDCRREILNFRQRHSPTLAAAEAGPVRSSAEAQSLVSLLYNEDAAPYVSRILRRLEAYLASGPDPDVASHLAEVYVERGSYEAAERHLDAALPGLPEERGRLDALFFRAGARAFLGRPAEAEADWKQCLELRKKSAFGRFDEKTIRQWLDWAAALPRPTDLRRLSGLRLPARDARLPDQDLRYREIAGGRAFWAGKQVLCASDPFARETVVVGRTSAGIRDFMPLDRDRVFVALTDRTAALYKEGMEKPLWTRPLSLGFHSCLSASPNLITAAEEDGTFHAIDPVTGKTLWTRKVSGEKWPDLWWRSERGMVLQGPNRVLVPVEKSRYEWIEGTTGKTLAAFKSRYGAEKGVTTKDAFFLVDRLGTLLSYSTETGADVWKTELSDSASYPLMEMALAPSVDGKTVAVAICDKLWMLDAASGKVLWTWRWSQPKKHGEQAWPRILPTPDGLFVLVNWEERGNRRGNRVDVCFLSGGGKQEFQQTGPPDPWKDSDYAEDPFVVGRSLALYQRAWEIWELPKK